MLLTPKQNSQLLQLIYDKGLLFLDGDTCPSASLLWCTSIHFKLIHFARVSLHVRDFKHLRQDYRCHKLRKTFFKFYRGHFELIKPCCNKVFPIRSSMIIMVYKVEKIIGNPNFSDIFKRIVNRFKRIGYNLDIVRHTSGLVITQLCLKAILYSLVAQRWSRLNDGFDVKL